MAQLTEKQVPSFAGVKKKFIPFEFEGLPKDAPPASLITVDLGGERMRCVVRRVIDADTIIVQVINLPFTKNHSFKQNDKIGAKRVKSAIGNEEWHAGDQREIFAMLESHDKAIASHQTHLDNEAEKKRKREQEALGKWFR